MSQILGSPVITQAVALEMLDMLYRYASECAECDGSFETVHANGPGPEDEYSLPCEACKDIRDLIDKAAPNGRPRAVPVPPPVEEEDDVSF